MAGIHAIAHALKSGTRCDLRGISMDDEAKVALQRAVSRNVQVLM